MMESTNDMYAKTKISYNQVAQTNFYIFYRISTMYTLYCPVKKHKIHVKQAKYLMKSNGKISAITTIFY